MGKVIGQWCMAKPGVTIFICVSCGGGDDASAGADASASPGRRLLTAVGAALAKPPDVTVTAVECLAVCRRPCTVALAGDGKWTYVIGDLDPLVHASDIVAAAQSYATTENGIIPWRQRPVAFRKGVISRVPPIGFSAVTTG